MKAEPLPRIPPPVGWFFNRCLICNRAFWTAEGYEGHYALVHILGLTGASQIVNWVVREE